MVDFPALVQKHLPLSHPVTHPAPLGCTAKQNYLQASLWSRGQVHTC